jgi:hypothetical protein
MRDHLPISIAEFNGLYDRGMDDAIPADHLAVCDNMHFLEREVVSRYGFSLPYTAATNIKRIALYKRIGEATRLLILDSSGNLYDSTSGVILSIATMTDFKVQTFFGRAYITPIDAANGIGVSGEFLYVYNGTSCRKAAGTAPTGTITVADSGLSGHVEAGFHLYAVAFETPSGFITKVAPVGLPESGTGVP